MKYIGSKNRIAKELVPIIQSFIDEDTTAYIEPFCLDGETNIYTKYGIKRVKDLKVGDYIYDENMKLQKVIRKVKTPETNGVKIEINRGLSFNTTADHKFYNINNEEVLAKNLNGEKLLVGSDDAKKMCELDISNQITYSENKKYGRSGSIIDGDKVKLYHNAPIMKRYLKIDEHLAFCYGLAVAEGDSSSITLNINEKELARRFISSYSKVIGQEFETQKIYYENSKKNSLTVAVPFKTIYEKIFFKELNIGHGARDKNISFLFKVNNDIAKTAIQAMFLGDGSLSYNKKYRSLNYKTSSRTLAYQLQTLLAVKFNIYSSLYHGWNKERKIDGRVLKRSDYYSIQIRRDIDIDNLLDIQNPDSVRYEQSSGYVVKSVSETKGSYYDITLEKESTHRYILDGGIVTHNCGGANMIDKIKHNNKIGIDIHTELIELLKYISNLENKLPQNITEKEYIRVRDNKEKYPKWYVGLVGFCATFGAKYYGGYARGFKADGITPRNLPNEAIRNIEKQRELLANIKFINASFSNLNSNKIKNAVIYCDPPYRDTTKYDTENFPYEDFYKWCKNMSKNNIVLISEYWMPDDFECIWEKKHKTSLGSGVNKEGHQDKVEKLFIYDDKNN